METAKEVKYYYGEILEHIKTVDLEFNGKCQNITPKSTCRVIFYCIEELLSIKRKRY